MVDDSPRRSCTQSTVRRLEIFESLAELNHLDRHDLINQLMGRWAIENADKDHQERIKMIFDIE